MTLQRERRLDASGLNFENGPRYDRDGYLVVSNVFARREVEAMRRELGRLKALGLYERGHRTGVERLRPLELWSPLLRALLFEPRFVALGDAVLRQPYFLRLATAWAMNGGASSAAVWREGQAPGHRRAARKAVTVWIALDDGAEWPEPVDASLGSVVLFSHDALERAGRRRRKLRSKAFDAVALDLWGGDAFDLTLLRRPACVWISGPRATGGERELGRDYRGEWMKEVKRARGFIDRPLRGSAVLRIEHPVKVESVRLLPTVAQRLTLHVRTSNANGRYRMSPLEWQVLRRIDGRARVADLRRLGNTDSVDRFVKMLANLGVARLE